MNRKINAVCFALILAGTCTIAWQSCTPKHAEEANVTAQLNSTEQLNAAEPLQAAEQAAEIEQLVVADMSEEVAAEPVEESFERKNCVRDPAKELYVTGLPTLASGDHLEWVKNNDYKAGKYSTIFYKVDESGNKTELYVMNQNCYTDYRFLSKDKQKLWFLVHNDDDHERSTYYGVYVLDGIAGTVDYLTEADFIDLSADEKYFICWDQKAAYADKNTGVEKTFYFDICNAATGEKISTIEWLMICHGWEMTITPTDDPSIMHVTYDPDGIEYAEAEIHLDTMTLQVIRDDTNLSYDELPAIYKQNIHP